MMIGGVRGPSTLRRRQFQFSARRGAAHHHIHLPAAALRTHQPLAPFENRCPGTVPSTNKRLRKLVRRWPGLASPTNIRLPLIGAGASPYAARRDAVASRKEYSVEVRGALDDVEDTSAVPDTVHIDLRWPSP